jgi:hypothetical protein
MKLLAPAKLQHTFNRVVDNQAVSELDHMQFASMALQIGACLCDPLVWVSVLGNLMFMDNTVLRVIFALVFLSNCIKLFIHYDMAEANSVEETARRDSIIQQENMNQFQVEAYSKLFLHTRMFLFAAHVGLWVTADIALWWLLKADTLVYDVPVLGPLGVLSPQQANNACVTMLTVAYAVDSTYFALIFFHWMSELEMQALRRMWFQIVRPCLYVSILTLASNVVPRSKAGL